MPLAIITRFHALIAVMVTTTCANSASGNAACAAFQVGPAAASLAALEVAV